MQCGAAVVCEGAGLWLCENSGDDAMWVCSMDKLNVGMTMQQLALQVEQYIVRFAAFSEHGRISAAAKDVPSPYLRP